VSYQSRVKKRRHKRVVAKARRRRNAETAARWFLIVAKRPGRCSVCRSEFDRGAEIVYCRVGREVRCLRCGEREPDSRGFRLSLNWERAKANQLKTTTRSARPEISAGETTTGATLRP
jgi:hypothetical protein